MAGNCTWLRQLIKLVVRKRIQSSSRWATTVTSSKFRRGQLARKMAVRRAFLIVLSLALCLSSNVAKADCNDATNTYNSAISDLSDALRRYSRCLSNSNGHDDCSSE